MKKILYQPLLRTINGTYHLPDEIYPNMAFCRIRDCMRWMKANGYPDFFVERIERRNIEDPLVIIDAEGNFEGGGSISCYNTEKELMACYHSLWKIVGEVIERTCGPVVLPQPCTLYEDDATLGVPYPEYTGERPNIVKIDRDYAYADDGRRYELSNITDPDDFDMLYTAVAEVLNTLNAK